MTTTLALFGNKVLRSAIQRNQVSFPAQMPLLAKNQAGDVQARMGQLYFVAGWTIRKISTRYGMSSETVRKSLTEWRVRAISSGYIQEIGPEIVPLPESPPVEVEEDTDTESVLHMVLNEIEAGVAREPAWPAFYVRLLEILQHECVADGLRLSAVQIERVKGLLQAGGQGVTDRIRDLRRCILDEERCAPVVIPLRPRQVALLAALTREIETSAELEGNLWNAGSSPSHCLGLMAAIRQGCLELGMEIDNSLPTQLGQLRELLRDLRHRLADEQEQTAQIRVPECQPRELIAGIYQ